MWTWRPWPGSPAWRASRATGGLRDGPLRGHLPEAQRAPLPAGRGLPEVPAAGRGRVAGAPAPARRGVLRALREEGPVTTVLVAAFCLDLLLGDPRWLPHPVRAMGWAAGVLERILTRRGGRSRWAGILLVGMVVGGTGVATRALLARCGRVHPRLRTLLDVALLYTALSARDLEVESMAVARALARGDDRRPRHRGPGGAGGHPRRRGGRGREHRGRRALPPRLRGRGRGARRAGLQGCEHARLAGGPPGRPLPGGGVGGSPAGRPPELPPGAPRAPALPRGCAPLWAGRGPLLADRVAGRGAQPQPQCGTERGRRGRRPRGPPRRREHLRGRARGAALPRGRAAASRACRHRPGGPPDVRHVPPGPGPPRGRPGRGGGREAPVNAFVVAAPHSGAGKTTITTGLLAALARRGHRVQAYKVGPDYIDPSYHRLATGRPSRTLDTWLCPPEVVRTLFWRWAADVNIVEGVMGLFDGGPGGRGSTAEVARLLDLPVVLVVDASRLAQSAGALIHGFATYDPGLRLVGVLFTRVASPSHAASLLSASPVPVLGWVEEDPSLLLPE